jgi:hypothetical protein
LESLLVDGVALLGNLSVNDHIKLLMRSQKGLALIIDIMQTYEHHSRLVCEA